MVQDSQWTVSLNHHLILRCNIRRSIILDLAINSAARIGYCKIRGSLEVRLDYALWIELLRTPESVYSSSDRLVCK